VKNLQESADDIAAVELRLLSDVSTAVSDLIVGPGYETRVTGHAHLWNAVDQCFIARGSEGPVILQYRPGKGDVRKICLDWWLDGTYDILYQDLADCLTLPDLGILIVTLQRCSELVVIDLEDNKKIGSIALAERSGSPLLIRLDAERLGTVDYDTLCSVEIASKTLVERVLVQPEINAVRHFAGPLSAGPTGLSVARPFSGDVLLFDGQSLVEKARAVTGGQPYDAIEPETMNVLARDWKTGAVYPVISNGGKR
jgi:hypothetical protein